MNKITFFQKNDHMILLEFFVEQVIFNEKVDPNLQAGRTKIDFQFLDNESVVIEETQAKHTPVCGTASFNMGKTCLFSLTPEQAVDASQLFELFVRVYQSKKCGHPQYVLVGITLIPLTALFKEILKKAGDKPSESSPGASKFIRHSVPITDLDENQTVVGHLCASIRLSCYGKYIQTDFRMDMEKSSIDYKANEAQYRLNYNKKFEPCPENCGPVSSMQCATPQTCGLNNPVVEPTPMPENPIDLTAKKSKPTTKDGASKGKGKDKNKKDKKKDKSGKGDKKAKEVNSGSCKTDTPCPESCPNVYNTLQEKKRQLEAEQLKKQMECPIPCPPSCYDKEKQTHVTWNDCPSNCPSAPTPEQGDCPTCCPVNKTFNSQSCPDPNNPQAGIQPCGPTGPCSDKNGQAPGQNAKTSPIGMEVQQQQKQFAPAFYLNGVSGAPQSPIQSCRQQPVTMMYASEPNYRANPPQNLFKMNMGLAGSLCCRIHEETPPEKIPCPVNYMAPPTLDGKCPFACTGNLKDNFTQNGNGSTSQGPPCLRPKQPQVIEMRPGMNDETPFRFTVGNGAIDQNQLCVSPPTFIAEDGTKYTEISDPKKQVFVMRIGKKFEGSIGGRNNIDLHLTTPPPPLAEPETSVQFQQYALSDTPPGATYSLGPKVIAGKAGKRGKAGKGGKGKTKKNADGLAKTIEDYDSGYESDGSQHTKTTLMYYESDNLKVGKASQLKDRIISTFFKHILTVLVLNTTHESTKS